MSDDVHAPTPMLQPPRMETSMSPFFLDIKKYKLLSMHYEDGGFFGSS